MKYLQLRMTATLMTLVSAVVAVGQPTPNGPLARPTLHSSVQAVVPGQPFLVALAFDIDPKCHIYWKNPGDKGLPPQVRWDLPEGFEVGSLRFPVPRRHVDQAKLTTFILEGSPTLVAQIAPPQTLSAEKITIVANAEWHVCKELPLREQKSLRLEMPVAAAGAMAEPANQDLFSLAERYLPKATAKHLKLTAAVDGFKPEPGAKFDLLLSIDIPKGLHIQSNRPLEKWYIAADVILEKADGINFAAPIYPKPKIREAKYLGKVSEFEGKITVRIPANIGDDAPAGPVRLAGLFTYQACTDGGQCYQPETVAFATTVGRTRRSEAAPMPDDRGTTVARMAPAAAIEGASFLERLGLGGLLLGCFLYGLVLNVTPCVFPILSIKIMGFIQQAHASRRRTAMLGLSFGIGVILFFVLLGFLAAQGKNVLQYPVAVIAFGAIVMALALSMLGVYTLRTPTAATKLEATIKKEGLVSSFGKGALAPVLGFACTGPFLAGAFAWATQQPPRIAVVAFVFAGLGMASPYVLLGANPHWLSFLPKPGNWMIIFERIMGFMLLGMVVYLLHPLVYHIGAEGFEWTLGFLVAVGLACWVLGQIDLNMSTGRCRRYRAGAVAIVVIAGTLVYGLFYPLGEAQTRMAEARLKGGPGDKDHDWSSSIPWRSWSAEAVEREVRAGKTVFVDFTAAYCPECRVNKGVATNTPEARNKMRSLGVVPFEADFTGGDPEMFAALRKHGQPGPPLNLIYPACRPDDPIKLPVVFSKATLLKALDRAGPSKPDGCPESIALNAKGD